MTLSTSSLWPGVCAVSYGVTATESSAVIHIGCRARRDSTFGAGDEEIIGSLLLSCTVGMTCCPRHHSLATIKKTFRITLRTLSTG